MKKQAAAVMKVKLYTSIKPKRTFAYVDEDEDDMATDERRLKDIRLG